MIKRNLRAEIARLRAEVKEMFGAGCPHYPNAIHLIFEADGHLRTSNLTPCKQCSKARVVHSICFLGTHADELESKSLYIPGPWLETFDNTRGAAIKIYFNVDLDKIF